MEKVCRHCRKKFTPHSSVPNQQFCGNTECQRARKRQWQREKLDRDPDYRENQTAAQKAWLDNHPDYWQEYRKQNPASAEKNRLKQRERNRALRHPSADPPPPMIVKMDELVPPSISISQQDRLVPIVEGMIAKMDELVLKFRSMSMDQPTATVSSP